MQGSETMAHTPRPWAIGVERPSSVTITDSKATYIATLMDGPGWWKDMAANARLIIAAPELLAACKVLLLAVDAAWEIGDLSPVQKVDEACEQASAAIASVTADDEHKGQ